MGHNADNERMTERFQLCAAKAWIEKIDEWAWEHRIRTRAEAIRTLVERALMADSPGLSGAADIAARIANESKDAPLFHQE
jgi:hypothetical protein